jgi:hypothetical protein
MVRYRHPTSDDAERETDKPSDSTLRLTAEVYVVKGHFRWPRRNVEKSADRLQHPQQTQRDLREAGVFGNVSQLRFRLRQSTYGQVLKNVFRSEL